ncbi:DUF2614 family zinc ribbon-containing protein [Bacillus tropicus]|uniref:DUF2614 family zinc ribbon-containing protein n=1 Tax=Bacillus tropicus TaxID=2026188 RepID=UPI0016432FF0
MSYWCLEFLLKGRQIRLHALFIYIAVLYPIQQLKTKDALLHIFLVRIMLNFLKSFISYLNYGFISNSAICELYPKRKDTQKVSFLLLI